MSLSVWRKESLSDIFSPFVECVVMKIAATTNIEMKSMAETQMMTSMDFICFYLTKRNLPRHRNAPLLMLLL